jgi:hypothetical protein
MPAIATDPPASSCNRLYPRRRFQESQLLGPDPFLPRARRARAFRHRAFRQRKLGQSARPAARYSQSQAGLSGEIPLGCGCEYTRTGMRLQVVMAGLDPAIHVLATGADGTGNPVDARVKPAHDDSWLVPSKPEQSITVLRTALRRCEARPAPGCVPCSHSVAGRLQPIGESAADSLQNGPTLIIDSIFGCSARRLQRRLR